MSGSEKSRRQLLAAPLLGVFAVACCLAGPLVVGAAGSLAAGAVFGLVAAGVVLLGLCLVAARRLRSGGRC